MNLKCNQTLSLPQPSTCNPLGSNFRIPLEENTSSAPPSYRRNQRRKNEMRLLKYLLRKYKLGIIGSMILPDWPLLVCNLRVWESKIYLPGKSWCSPHAMRGFHWEKCASAICACIARTQETQCYLRHCQAVHQTPWPWMRKSPMNAAQ